MYSPLHPNIHGWLEENHLLFAFWPELAAFFMEYHFPVTNYGYSHLYIFTEMFSQKLMKRVCHFRENILSFDYNNIQLSKKNFFFLKTCINHISLILINACLKCSSVKIFWYCATRYANVENINISQWIIYNGPFRMVQNHTWVKPLKMHDK